MHDDHGRSCCGLGAKHGSYTGVADGQVFELANGEIPGNDRKHLDLRRNSDLRFSSMGLAEAAKTTASDTGQQRDRHNLPADTWGVGIVVVVKDLAELISGNWKEVHFIRFTFSIIVLALNTTIQMMMLVWVNEFIVHPQVLDIQQHYKAYHEEAFTSVPVTDKFQHFSEVGWNNFMADDEKASLCQAALSNTPFISTVIFLWALRILQEFRDTDYLRQRVHDLPDLSSSITFDEMVQENRKDETGEVSHDIVALTGSVRAGLYVLIVIPKYIIACVLLWLGSRWLVSTESFSDLILNVMALEFIIGVDELFFLSLFPSRMAEHVAMVKFAPPWTNHVAQIHDEQHTISAFRASIGCLCLAVAWVVLYLRALQMVLPGYQYDLWEKCAEFESEDHNLLCHGFWEWECWGYGPNDEVEGTMRWWR